MGAATAGWGQDARRMLHDDSSLEGAPRNTDSWLRFAASAIGLVIERTRLLRRLYPRRSRPRMRAVERADASGYARAPRRRDFKTAPMILTNPETVGSRSTLGDPGLQADAEASLDSTTSPALLNLIRNALNAEICRSSIRISSRLGHSRTAKPRAIRPGDVGQSSNSRVRRRQVQGQYADRASKAESADPAHFGILRVCSPRKTIRSPPDAARPRVHVRVTTRSGSKRRAGQSGHEPRQAVA